jgi:tRNA threonylcarbamoyladenosine biosynthesis protein TsaE
MGPLQELTIVTHSAQETGELGEALGALALPGDLLLLSGELGAGKTCLVQGIARGLGVQTIVRSPTFVFATEHMGRLPLYHVDLYRVDDPREADGLGLDDYIEGDGVCAVEWAERAIDLFPADHILIEMAHVDTDDRSLHLIPSGQRYTELLDGLREHIEPRRPPG